MWKRTSLITALIVLALLSSFYLFGLATEKRYSLLMQRISTLYDVQADIKEYQRGWFNSKAIVTLKLTVPKQNNANVEQRYQINEPTYVMVRMVDRIQHGPVIKEQGKLLLAMASIHSRFQLAEQQQQALQQILLLETPQIEATLHSLIKISGRTEMRLLIKPLTVWLVEWAAKLDWQGLRSDWTLSADAKQFRGDIDIGDLKLTSKQGPLQLTGLTVHYDMNERDYGLWVGNFDFELPSLFLQDRGGQPFSMNRGYFHWTSNMVEQLLSMDFQLGLQKIIVLGEQYGPLKGRAALTKLDAQAVADIRQQLKQLDKSNFSKQQQHVFNLALLSKLPYLFTNGSEFRLHELEFATPAGTISVSGHVGLPKWQPEQEFIVMTPLLKQLDVALSAKLPRPFMQQIAERVLLDQYRGEQLQQEATMNNKPSSAEQTSPPKAPLSKDQMIKLAKQGASAQVEQWEKQGLIKLSGDYYQLEMQLKNGEWRINEQLLYDVKQIN